MGRSLQAALISSLAFLVTACGGGGVAVLPPGNAGSSATDSGVDARGRAAFYETWSEFSSGTIWADGAVYGRWTDQWNGYGAIDVVGTGAQGSGLSLAPLAASPWDHSALVTTTAPLANFSASVTLTTRKQLSTAPNPWEVGWVLWGFSDNTHFYAFTPQPNGWELSKQDPSYPGAQRFLATGSSPKFPVGTTYTVSIAQQGALMSVWVNGALIVSFTDRERPYLRRLVRALLRGSHRRLRSGLRHAERNLKHGVTIKRGSFIGGLAALGAPATARAFGFARALIVVNHRWEYDALEDACTYTRVHPFPARYQRASAVRGLRGRFDSANGSVEVWCIEDLLPPGAGVRSSAAIARVLPAVVGGNSMALVVAVGTAASVTVKPQNGSVVIGSNTFMHDPHVANSSSHWNPPHPDVLVPSAIDTATFRNIVGSEADLTAIDPYLLPAPLAPALRARVFADPTFVALADINVTRSEDDALADPAVVRAYRRLGSRAPIGSLDTTHAVIRACTSAPFFFISGITNRIGAFDAEVATAIRRAELRSGVQRRRDGGRLGPTHALLLGSLGGAAMACLGGKFVVFCDGLASGRIGRRCVQMRDGQPPGWRTPRWSVRQEIRVQATIGAEERKDAPTCEQMKGGR